MLLKNLMHSGWLHALFIGLIGYPLGGMSQKFLVSYTDGNILVYTVFLMLSSSIVLLLVAGPGELASKTLKRPETWLYGLTQIGSYVFALLIFQYVSASEGAALGKIAIVVILILSMLFLNQKTNRYELLGSVIIIFGLYLIMDSLNLSTEAKAIVIAFVISRALVQGGQKIIAEIHKTNRKANSFKSQIRVTGFIMAVTSFIFFLFLLTMSYIKQDNDISFLKTFPDFNEYANMQVFLFAALLGLVIVSACKYCEFFASKSIGAKYLAAITSLELVAIYIMENILSNLGLISPKVIDPTIITALVLVIIGSILISIAGFIKDFSFIKKGEKQDTLANLDDNFIEDEKDFKLLKLNLANLLTLYDKNSKKLAEDLDIDRIMLDNIMNYHFEEVRVKNKIAKKINDFASHKVGNLDKLTKAYNRYYLDHKVEELLKENNPFKLYFLDLNKFKPINDEHGHEAGDVVLETTIPRLINLEEFNDCVFRVGGDEFVLLQINNLEENLEDLITDTIELPVEYNNTQLQISTSIGRVHSDNYETLEDMLKDADALMFENKKAKGVNR